MTASVKFGDIRDTDDPAGVDNPYWQVVRRQPGKEITAKYHSGRWEPDSHPHPRGKASHRNDLVSEYSWAITDPASVAFVAEHSGGRVVEVGAGLGYWAWQLSQRGVDVIAYDIAPPNRALNHFHPAGHNDDGSPKAGTRRTWHQVVEGQAEASALHPDRTLFLCWPPYDSPMAAAALRAYRGDRLIYIGEGPGGCTADDDFHRMLGFRGWDDDDWDEPNPDAEWVEVAEHCPVQWWGLHDRITVYDRKPRSLPAGRGETAALTTTRPGALPEEDE